MYVAYLWVVIVGVLRSRGRGLSSFTHHMSSSSSSSSFLSNSLLGDFIIPFSEAASLSLKDACLVGRIRCLCGMAFIEQRSVVRSLFPSVHVEWDMVQNYLKNSKHTPSEWVAFLTLFDFLHHRPALAGPGAGAAGGVLGGDNNNNNIISNDIIDGGDHHHHPVSGEAMGGDVAAGLLLLKHANHNNSNNNNNLGGMLMQKQDPLESMRGGFAKFRLNLHWTMIARALVASCLEEVDPVQGLECFIEAHWDALGCAGAAVDASQIAAGLLKHISAYRHTPKEYEQVFLMLFSKENSRLDEGRLTSALQAISSKQELIRMNVASMLSSSMRPSLESMCERFQQMQFYEKKEDGCGFWSFCHGLRLPVNGNHRSKLMTYYIACLPEDVPERERYLSKFVAIDNNGSSSSGGGHDDNDGGGGVGGGGSRGVLRECAVSTPDVRALKEVILGTVHSGPPFEALQRFRDACVYGGTGSVGGVAHIKTLGISWTPILQLYLCSYCRPCISKDLWNSVLRIILSGEQYNPETLSWLHITTSPEVEGRIQSFVHDNFINLNAVTRLMEAS